MGSARGRFGARWGASFGRVAPGVAGALALLGAVAAGPAQASSSTLYRWVDERGVIHFTNTPLDERYTAVSVRKPMGPSLGPQSPAHFEATIVRSARLHGLPPALVKAVIRAESNFDPRARSHKGAMGLMQLMPETAEEMGVRDPWRAEDNIRGGTRYLRSMVNRYGDVRLALAAYNAGPRAVDRYRGIPPYQETQEYVRRVLAYYRKYHGDLRR